jgi:hypothetical protein
MARFTFLIDAMVAFSAVVSMLGRSVRVLVNIAEFN